MQHTPSRLVRSAATALIAIGIAATPSSAQLQHVATRPALPDDLIALSPWVTGEDTVTVDVWAGLVGGKAFKAGLLYNAEAGPELAGQQAGPELLINGKELWGALGQPVDILCSTIIKPGKVLILLDSGHIIELAGIWGTGGVAKPKSVLTYSLGLPPSAGKPTAFAEGLRGFASYIDAATPLIAIGTDNGHFGFAGFETPDFGFENPIISFENPIISFDDPLVAGPLGFDEPALGFGTPLSAFPIADVAFAADKLGHNFAVLAGPELLGINPGLAYDSEAESVSAKQTWIMNGGEFVPGLHDLGGVQLPAGFPPAPPAIDGKPLLLSGQGGLISALNVPVDSGPQPFDAGFDFVMPSDDVNLCNHKLFGVNELGQLFTLPGYDPADGVAPQLEGLVTKGGVQSSEMPSLVELQLGMPAPPVPFALEGLFDDVIDGKKGIDLSSLALSIESLNVKLHPTQVQVTDSDGDGHTELLGLFNGQTLVRVLSTNGLGVKTDVTVSWLHFDGKKGSSIQSVTGEVIP